MKLLNWLLSLFKSTSTPVSKPAPSVPVKPLPVPVKDEQPASDKKKNPPKWYLVALSYLGKNEADNAFDKFLSNFWAIVGLKGYKTIAGSKYAWCGLFIAAALNISGYQWAKNGAGARNWGKFGTDIEWQVKGIPQGAIVHINHEANCSSSKRNHVALANGDCAAAELSKSGASISLLGGNQNNRVSVATYPVKKICEVVWPSDADMPELPIKQSLNCSNGKIDKGSTE